MLVTSLALANQAGADGAPEIYFRGSLGYGQMSLAGFNSAVAAQGSQFGQRDEFGGSPLFAIEAGLITSPVLSFGLNYEHQSSTIRNSGGRTFLDTLPPVPVVFRESVEEDLRLAVDDLTIRVAARPLRGLQRLTLGLAVGVAITRYSVTSDWSLADTALVAKNHSQGSFQGGAFSLGAFTGWEQPLGAQLELFGLVGYRHRTANYLWGKYEGEDLGHKYQYQATPYQMSEATTPFDLSGAFAQVGVGWKFEVTGQRRAR
jgi:hypothetical protein